MKLYLIIQIMNYHNILLTKNLYVGYFKPKNEVTCNN